MDILAKTHFTGKVLFDDQILINLLGSSVEISTIFPQSQ